MTRRIEPTSNTTGETIRIEGRAPIIDQGSTRQGITITRDYLRQIPVPGRTFESALGSSAGSQRDGHGVSFSGSTSIENTYYVDGVGTGVRSDTLSPLANDVLAHRLRSNAFAFGLPTTPAPARTAARAPGRPASPSPEPTARIARPVAPAIDPLSPYTGELQDVMAQLASGRRDEALELATRWRNTNPGDLAALIAFGESLEARGATGLAARAYASIIDLYPNRFELVRAAGERLDRVPGANAFAVDAYRRSLRERPDQLSTYRLLAFALFRGGKASEALDVLLAGRARARTASGRGADQQSVRAVLLQDARVIAAALVARDAGSKAAIERKLGSPVASVPSMHLVLGWETDANDVDLHVVDKHGNHASYSQRKLASGGELLDDLTDGYGPEMFAVDWPQAFPYSVAVHYFNRGPQGLGIGTVQIIRHDGKGKVEIEDRPFVLQKVGSTIPLGAIR
ncbi:MAG: hypothetical protein H0V17_16860 [Deltaproteobacteria bacterium]|nr:hypothetical protein [Deltaproteobacteria bacterium]